MKLMFMLLTSLLFGGVASAAEYQLTENAGIVLRLKDGAFIPNDPRNADRMSFDAWQKAGGVPDAFVPPDKPVPQSVSVMQAKVALFNAGLLDSVEDWIGKQDARTQLIWNSAVAFNRNSQLIAAAASALGLSSSDVDQLFVAAAEINP